MSPHEGLPKKTRVIAVGASKQERASARRALGKLKQNVISLKKEDRYSASYTEFIKFHRLSRHFAMPPFPILDDMVAEYVEHLWESGEPKSAANYVVAAIHHHRPETRHHLPWAWKLVKVWNQLEVPQRATRP